MSTGIFDGTVGKLTQEVAHSIADDIIVNKLIRPEDKEAFQHDVITVFPNLSASYRSVCPMRIDLGKMQSNVYERYFDPRKKQQMPRGKLTRAELKARGISPGGSEQECVLELLTTYLKGNTKGTGSPDDILKMTFCELLAAVIATQTFFEASENEDIFVIASRFTESNIFHAAGSLVLKDINLMTDNAKRYNKNNPDPFYVNAATSLMTCAEEAVDVWVKKWVAAFSEWWTAAGRDVVLGLIGSREKETQVVSTAEITEKPSTIPARIVDSQLTEELSQKQKLRKISPNGSTLPCVKIEIPLVPAEIPLTSPSITEEVANHVAEQQSAFREELLGTQETQVNPITIEPTDVTLPHDLYSAILEKHLYRGRVGTILAVRSGDQLVNGLFDASDSNEKANEMSSILASNRLTTSHSSNRFEYISRLSVYDVLEKYYKETVHGLKNSVVSSSSTSEVVIEQFHQQKKRELQGLLTLFCRILAEAIATPVILYHFEIAELYRLAHGGEYPWGAFRPKNVVVKRERDNNLESSTTSAHADLRTPEFWSNDVTFFSNSGISWQEAVTLCSKLSAEYLLRMLIWFPRIVEELISGTDSVFHGKIQEGKGTAKLITGAIISPFVQDIINYLASEFIPKDMEKNRKDNISEGK